MFYYKQGKKEVKKYYFSFDKKVLEEFKKEVIDRCSEITHYEYDSDKFPERREYSEIRNFRYEVIGAKESDDGYYTKDYIYHIGFDEYKYPYLVCLLDRLLIHNDFNAIDEIFRGSKNETFVPFKDRINIVSNELDAIENTDIANKRAKLEELQALINAAKLNETQEPISDYYNELKSIMNIKYLGSLSYDVIDQVSEFLDEYINFDRINEYNMEELYTGRGRN